MQHPSEEIEMPSENSNNTVRQELAEESAILMQQKKNKGSLNTLLTILGLVLVGAAIYDQLRQPAESRTWQGTIVGIPYDFRIPTIERIRAKLWNADTTSILTPHLFGVGWSINFYPLLHPKNS